MTDRNMTSYFGVYHLSQMSGQPSSTITKDIILISIHYWMWSYCKADRLVHIISITLAILFPWHPVQYYQRFWKCVTVVHEIFTAWHFHWFPIVSHFTAWTFPRWAIFMYISIIKFIFTAWNFHWLVLAVRITEMSCSKYFHGVQYATISDKEDSHLKVLLSSSM